VEPLTGRDASVAARSIGLPAFAGNETGTTIAIISPNFDERAPQEAMRLLGEALLRNFWPKMVDGEDRRGTMLFDLSWNGDRVPIQRPEDVPPLNGFVQAFHNLEPRPSGKATRGERFVRQIECLKPIEQLGRLSLTRFPVSPRLASTVEAVEGDDLFTGPSHHVALLRGPRFVV